MRKFWLVFAVFACLGKQQTFVCGDAYSDTQLALKSLGKVNEFYADSIDDQYVDGLFGLRAAQGALHKVIYDRKPKNKQLASYIQRTYTKISDTADDIFESLKLKNTAYFQKFYFLLKTKWFFMLPRRPVDHSLIESHAEKVASFNEKKSDHCITEIAGSQSDEEPCKISESCWHTTTRRNTLGYMITHQALYFIVGIKKGCRSKFIKKFGGEKIWHTNLMRLGANIYSQMITKYNTGHFQKGNEQNDIFTEQIFVCQLLGVNECFDSKLLHLVASWQEESGCWKIVNKDSTGTNDEGGKMFGSSSNEDDINDDGRQVSRFSSRKLLRDRLHGDGCSMHLTSVATGMLGMSVYGSNWEMQRTTSTRKFQRSFPSNDFIYSREDDFSLFT